MDRLGTFAALEGRRKASSNPKTEEQHGTAKTRERIPHDVEEMEHSRLVGSL